MIMVGIYWDSRSVSIWRMLVEHAIKNYYNIAQEMEFVMYNRGVEVKYYQYVKDKAE